MKKYAILLEILNIIIIFNRYIFRLEIVMKAKRMKRKIVGMVLSFAMLASVIPTNVMEVKAAGEVIHVATFKDLSDALISEQDATIILDRDIVVGTTMKPQADKTLDLNGNKLVEESGEIPYVFSLENLGDFTVKNGTINSSSEIFRCKGYGNLKIENGSYNVNSSSSKCVFYVGEGSGNITINDGSFTNTGTYQVVHTQAYETDRNFTINGGAFYANQNSVLGAPMDDRVKIIVNKGSFVSNTTNTVSFYHNDNKPLGTNKVVFVNGKKKEGATSLSSDDIGTNNTFVQVGAEADFVDVTMENPVNATGGLKINNAFSYSTKALKNAPLFYQITPNTGKSYIGGRVTSGTGEFGEKVGAFYTYYPTSSSSFKALIGRELKPGEIEVSDNFFPDLKLLDKIAALPGASDDVLTKEEREAIKTLDLSYSGSGDKIKDLTGVEYFTEVTSLDLSDNSIGSFDGAVLPKLVTLKCSNNAMSSLNVTDNANLGTLNCSENNLSGLNVSANTKLKTLNCSSNNLSGLSLTKNSALLVLNAANNNMSSVDISTTALCTKEGTTSNIPVVGNQKNSKTMYIRMSHAQEKIFKAAGSLSGNTKVNVNVIHVCSNSFPRVEPTVKKTGVLPYFQCTCGEYFEDPDGAVLIPDLAAWKVGAGMIPKLPLTPEYCYQFDVEKPNALEKPSFNQKHEYNGVKLITVWFSTDNKVYADADGKELLAKSEGVADFSKYLAKKGYEEIETFVEGKTYIAKLFAVGEVDVETPFYADGKYYDVAYSDKYQALTVTKEEEYKSYVSYHEHRGFVTNKNKATCTRPGTIPYYECSCGKIYTTATCEEEIEDINAWAEEAGYKNPLGHMWSELGIVTKKPTQTEPGEMTYYCLNDPEHKKVVAIKPTGIKEEPVATPEPTVAPEVTPSPEPSVAPEKPSKASATAKNTKKKSVVIKIKSTKNAKSYKVQYSTSKKFKKAKTKTTTKLSITIKSLKKKKTYYFRVCGVNGKLVGAWSKTMKVKIKK